MVRGVLRIAQRSSGLCRFVAEYGPFIHTFVVIRSRYVLAQEPLLALKMRQALKENPCIHVAALLSTQGVSATYGCA
jgi:hypothetical protein